MSSNNLFKSSEEELERLIQEITAIKESMREISVRLNQLERYAQKAFGKPATQSKNTPTPKQLNTKADVSTISVTEASALFDRIVSIWDEQGADVATKAVEGLPVTHLRVLAHEIGVPSSSSLRELRKRVTTRVNESVLLSRPASMEMLRRTQSDPVNE